jgi:uncharacterized protein YbaA (DUF1428 family)
VRDIDRAAVQHFVDWLTTRPGRAGRLCDRSIANALTPLRLTLDAAVAEGLLAANPGRPSLGIVAGPRAEEPQVPYVEGFVAAVPTANKEKYIKQAREATAYFKSLGATRIVECWGDDVPKGEVTDFYKAVQAKEDETVIFSWIEYPNKATRDAANEKMAADSDTDMEMPFDSKRMFWGGFEPVVSE